MSCNNRNQRQPRVINADQVFINAEEVFIVEDNHRRRGNNVAGAQDNQGRNDRKHRRDDNNVAGAEDNRRDKKCCRRSWL